MGQHAILRFGKNKGNPARPLEAHHERQKEQYASNPDIDTSRSKYNFHIVKPEGCYYHFIQSRIEQGGTRPILVIQNNVGNHFSPTIVVAAITSRKVKSSLPTHILLENVPGLAPTSLLLLEQLRTIDRKRLCGYIGRITKEKMLEVDAALAISIGLNPQA